MNIKNILLLVLFILIFIGAVITDGQLVSQAHVIKSKCYDVEGSEIINVFCLVKDTSALNGWLMIIRLVELFSMCMAFVYAFKAGVEE